MEGFENKSSLEKVRTRRKRFFAMLMAVVMIMASPAIDAYAQSVSFGNIHSNTTDPFVPASKYGIHIQPGESISWGIGNPANAVEVTVNYLVDGVNYADNAVIRPTGTADHFESGEVVSYTVKTLATATDGANMRVVDYWELQSVDMNGDIGDLGDSTVVTSITLAAHFAATPVPPKGKTDEVLTLVGGGEDKGPQLPPHEHAYTWIKTRETTEEVDGEWSYKCECGDVKYRIPESGAFAFIRNAIDNINKTPQGGTVEIKTRRWLVFNKAVADAISDRPDVTIKLSYLEGGYKGDGLTTTLPAGTDLHQYLDEKGYVGFLFLKTIFPTERTLWNK